MLTECPNCLWSDEVEDEYLGQAAECPQCENDFVVNHKQVQQQAPVPAAKPKLKVGKRPKTRVGAGGARGGGVGSRMREQASADGEVNPYAAPKSSVRPRRRSRVEDKVYPGIRRLPYFGLSIAVNIVSTLINLALPLLGTLVALVAGFFVVIPRLKNIGYSPWLSILMLVPLANLWLGAVCIACPEGYADHKTFDTAGKIVLGLMIGLFALMIIGIVVAFSSIR